MAHHEAAHALASLACTNEADIWLTPDHPTRGGFCLTRHQDLLEGVFVSLAGPAVDALRVGGGAASIGEDIRAFEGSGRRLELQGHDYAQALAALEEHAAHYVALGQVVDRDTLLTALVGATVCFFSRHHVRRALARIAEALLASPDRCLLAADVRRLAACARWRSDPRTHYRAVLEAAGLPSQLAVD
ncbi:MAG: hypothetical protein JWN04_107 [Myxococcaceae bacterium]|nr:hypothetical protein [Myxococcaceae bacterium]